AALASAPLVPQGAPSASAADADLDGVPAEVESLAANNGDGNHDGIADAQQADVASVRATAGAMGTFEALRHPLSDVQVLPETTARQGPSRLPYGLFSFQVANVPVGGIAEVRMLLPPGARPTGYLKQDPVSGKLAPFGYDGTTGAKVQYNVITLALQD